VSYGTRFADMYRHVGVYSGQILNGAAAGTLPVQQPTRYELVVDLKTARLQGITIPQSILLRADERADRMRTSGHVQVRTAGRASDRREHSKA